MLKFVIFNRFECSYSYYLQVPTTSLSDSINLVQRGDAIAYIEFPANFTYFLWNRIAYGNYADNETVQGSSVNFRMDVSGTYAYTEMM